MLNRLFDGSWLGHGRKLECFFACVVGAYGLHILVVPQATWDSQANRDLVWLGWGYLLPYPCLLFSALSGLGLYLNIAGKPYSRVFRIAGALLGNFIFLWYLAKYWLFGRVGTLGFYFCLWAALYSVTILKSAVANKPTPGAPGQR